MLKKVFMMFSPKAWKDAYMRAGQRRLMKSLQKQLDEQYQAFYGEKEQQDEAYYDLFGNQFIKEVRK